MERQNKILAVLAGVILLLGLSTYISNKPQNAPSRGVTANPNFDQQYHWSLCNRYISLCRRLSSFSDPKSVNLKKDNNTKQDLFPVITTPSTNQNNVKAITSNESYNILCTTVQRQMTWGSFAIRCKDLKTWAERCAPTVNIHLVPFESVSRLKHNDTSFGNFDATISVKGTFKYLDPFFGTIYIDVVDAYKIKQKSISKWVHVIVQNQLHASAVFPKRKSHVVGHWFNSYPADMITDNPVHKIPKILPGDTSLRMATVWYSPNFPCPSLSKEVQEQNHILYDCISGGYRIETWYKHFFTTPQDRELARIFLKDPQLGPGYLYFQLFWKFDVLVVPEKQNSRDKLRYNSMQRVLSQFRSGVPTLLEMGGGATVEFINLYNYTCVFVNYRRKNVHKSIVQESNSSIHRRKYWTFDEAAVAMRSIDLRRQCQQEGLRIAKDNTPSRIAQKFIRTVGYQGDFRC